VDAGDGQVAVAVAAIGVVAAVRSGEIPDSDYWPRLPHRRRWSVLPDDLTAPALSMLDRVTGEQSELRELWIENGPNPEWESQTTVLRTALIG
jgi:hypothetical protein